MQGFSAPLPPLIATIGKGGTKKAPAIRQGTEEIIFNRKQTVS